MKGFFVALSLFIVFLYWAATVMQDAADVTQPKKTYIALDDDEVAERLQKAEKHWRQIGASITNIDAPRRTNKQIMAVHDEWKALREEHEARKKARGH